MLAPAYEALGKGAPDQSDFATMYSEVVALRSENQHMREHYEARVKNLEREREKLSQILSMLKYQVREQLDGVFDESNAS